MSENFEFSVDTMNKSLRILPARRIAPGGESSRQTLPAHKFQNDIVSLGIMVANIQ